MHDGLVSLSLSDSHTYSPKDISHAIGSVDFRATQLALDAFLKPRAICSAGELIVITDNIIGCRQIRPRIAYRSAF